MNPLVSVIIPTKNSARTLEACLESVKGQSYGNPVKNEFHEASIELIVVDNNSTDNTKEIALSFCHSRAGGNPGVFEVKVFNWGPERSAQRNYGVKQAGGEYLLIHDSDIYFNFDTVKECVELSEREKCDAIILPEKSIGMGFWSKVKSFERSFYVGNEYIEAARFFKKDVYEKMGGYDEDLTGPEDWDLTIRLRKSGAKICRINSFIEHDEGEISLFGSSAKKKYYARDMFEKYAKKHPEEFKKQMSFFVRFPLNKIIKKGIYHPIMFCGMIIIKSLELINSKR